MGLGSCAQESISTCCDACTSAAYHIHANGCCCRITCGHTIEGIGLCLLEHDIDSWQIVLAEARSMHLLRSSNALTGSNVGKTGMKLILTRPTVEKERKNLCAVISET